MASYSCKSTAAKMSLHGRTIPRFTRDRGILNTPRGAVTTRQSMAMWDTFPPWTIFMSLSGRAPTIVPLRQRLASPENGMHSAALNGWHSLQTERPCQRLILENSSRPMVVEDSSRQTHPNRQLPLRRRAFLRTNLRRCRRSCRRRTSRSIPPSRDHHRTIRPAPCRRADRTAPSAAG